MATLQSCLPLALSALDFTMPVRDSGLSLTPGLSNLVQAEASFIKQFTSLPTLSRLSQAIQFLEADDEGMLNTAN